MLKPTKCLLCGGRGPHDYSTGAHDYLPASAVVAVLDAWIAETNRRSECERGLPAAPLARATQALVSIIVAIANTHRPRRTTAVAWANLANQVISNISEIALRFISDEYGDDDTDAPCDVEWDVHSLVKMLDPAYIIPEEIEPAHVIGTVFPHPSDDV